MTLIGNIAGFLAFLALLWIFGEFSNRGHLRWVAVATFILLAFLSFKYGSPVEMGDCETDWDGFSNSSVCS